MKMSFEQMVIFLKNNHVIRFDGENGFYVILKKDKDYEKFKVFACSYLGMEREIFFTNRTNFLKAVNQSEFDLKKAINQLQTFEGAFEEIKILESFKAALEKMKKVMEANLY